MADENEHAAVVTAWLESCAAGLPSKRLAALFEQALQALWRRAHVTLGDVTLSAIVERVLHVAAGEHPVFSGVKIDASGIRFDEFRDQAESLPVVELAAGVRFVLIEFLSVLGSLTAEILTSPLHEQLLRVVPEEPPRSKAGTNARAPGARRTKDPES